MGTDESPTDERLAIDGGTCLGKAYTARLIMATLRLESGVRVLFIGDSNTDTDYRTRAEPLGYGYVMMVGSLIAASRPEMGIEVINRGNDADTVIHLENRWQEDVIDIDPDWLFVMVGTNDVGNRYIDGLHHAAVSDATFESTLRRLVDRTRAASGTRIVLIDPPVFDLPLDSPPNQDLEVLSSAIERVARDLDCGHVPVRAGMASALAAGQTSGWFQNFNHPHFPGHAFIALEILRHIDWRFESPDPG